MILLIFFPILFPFIIIGRIAAIAWIGISYGFETTQETLIKSVRKVRLSDDSQTSHPPHRPH